MGCNKKKYILYIVSVYLKYKFFFKNFIMLKYVVLSKDCILYFMFIFDVNVLKLIW